MMGYLMIMKQKSISFLKRFLRKKRLKNFLFFRRKIGLVSTIILGMEKLRSLIGLKHIGLIKN